MLRRLDKKQPSAFKFSPKNLAWAKTEIPSDFWNELSKLPYSNEDPEANRVYKPS